MKKNEAWNSLRVSIDIPKEAAQKLKQLATSSDSALKELGILAVQLASEPPITLPGAGRRGIGKAVQPRVPPPHGTFSDAALHGLEESICDSSGCANPLNLIHNSHINHTQAKKPKRPRRPRDASKLKLSTVPLPHTSAVTSMPSSVPATTTTISSPTASSVGQDLIVNPYTGQLEPVKPSPQKSTTSSTDSLNVVEPEPSSPMVTSTASRGSNLSSGSAVSNSATHLLKGRDGIGPTVSASLNAILSSVVQREISGSQGSSVKSGIAKQWLGAASQPPHTTLKSNTTDKLIPTLLVSSRSATKSVTSVTSLQGSARQTPTSPAIMTALHTQAKLHLQSTVSPLTSSIKSSLKPEVPCTTTSVPASVSKLVSVHSSVSSLSDSIVSVSYTASSESKPMVVRSMPQVVVSTASSAYLPLASNTSLTSRTSVALKPSVVSRSPMTARTSVTSSTTVSSSKHGNGATLHAESIHIAAPISIDDNPIPRSNGEHHEVPTQTSTSRNTSQKTPSANDVHEGLRNGPKEVPDSINERVGQHLVVERAPQRSRSASGSSVCHEPRQTGPHSNGEGESDQISRDNKLHETKLLDLNHHEAKTAEKVIGKNKLSLAKSKPLTSSDTDLDVEIVHKPKPDVIVISPEKLKRLAPVTVPSKTQSDICINLEERDGKTAHTMKFNPARTRVTTSASSKPVDTLTNTATVIDLSKSEHVSKLPSQHSKPSSTTTVKSTSKVDGRNSDLILSKSDVLPLGSKTTNPDLNLSKSDTGNKDRMTRQNKPLQLDVDSKSQVDSELLCARLNESSEGTRTRSDSAKRVDQDDMRPRAESTDGLLVRRSRRPTGSSTTSDVSEFHDQTVDLTRDSSPSPLPHKRLTSPVPAKRRRTSREDESVDRVSTRRSKRLDPSDVKQDTVVRWQNNKHNTAVLASSALKRMSTRSHTRSDDGQSNAATRKRR